MSDLSEFEEMYLKRIFEAHFAEPGEIVRTTKLAELMEVSPASTTEMIQRLSVRDYVTYIPYKGCRLTSEGFKHSSRIKRREELLKILLTDVIRFDGDIDSVACREDQVARQVEACAVEIQEKVLEQDAGLHVLFQGKLIVDRGEGWDGNRSQRVEDGCRREEIRC